jgi:hypothetical protein
MWPVKIENGDRRYCVFQVSPHRVGDHAYFRELYTWMQCEENQREFFNLLANMDLTGYHPRQSVISNAFKCTCS